MKLFLSLMMVAVVSFNVVTAQQTGCPNGIRRRYEWRDLPSTEIDKFLSAIQRLHTQGEGYNQLSRKHFDNYRNWHRGGFFFPVHRRFMMEFEAAILAIDPTVNMPYWAWSLSALNPGQDPIWQRFSRDGERRPVTDGILGNKLVSTPQPHSLVRGTVANGPTRFMTFQGNSVETFTSVSVLATLTQNTPVYDDFRERIEFGSHYYIHASIGGETGDFNSQLSVNDPIFWLHHGYVDKLWWDWQNTGTGRRNMINGETQEGSNVQVQASDILPSYSERVQDMFDINALCYTYMPPGSTFSAAPGPVSPTPVATTSQSMPTQSPVPGQSPPVNVPQPSNAPSTPGVPPVNVPQQPAPPNTPGSTPGPTPGSPPGGRPFGAVGNLLNSLTSNLGVQLPGFGRGVGNGQASGGAQGEIKFGAASVPTSGASPGSPASDAISASPPSASIATGTYTLNSAYATSVPQNTSTVGNGSYSTTSNSSGPSPSQISVPHSSGMPQNHEPPSAPTVMPNLIKNNRMVDEKRVERVRKIYNAAELVAKSPRSYGNGDVDLCSIAQVPHSANWNATHGINGTQYGNGTNSSYDANQSLSTPIATPSTSDNTTYESPASNSAIVGDTTVNAQSGAQTNVVFTCLSIIPAALFLIM